ncbi:signal peptidase I [bacterium]|nr:signal peptidase I [bacterium]
MTKQKFIQMTKSEFAEAMDVIKKSIIDDLKYSFSKQPFINSVENMKNDFRGFIGKFSGKCADKKEETTTENEDDSSIIDDIKNFFKDITRPLTKDLFIERALGFKNFIYETFSTVVFVIVGVIIIRFFIVDVRWIPSGSMIPTIKEGDRVFVERFSRFYSTPQRGDIMVFYPPFTELEYTPVLVFKRLTGFFCKDVAFIKRVIGLPGEKFEIKKASDGTYSVYINNKPLEEPYIKSNLDYTPCERIEINCGPFTIPEHEYLMLGDNRDGSWDGRFWGTVDEDMFIGKAVFRFWPVTRIKPFVRPKY